MDRQVWKMQGDRIWKFCGGSPTSLSPGRGARGRRLHSPFQGRSEDGVSSAIALPENGGGGLAMAGGAQKRAFRVSPPP